MSGAVFSSLQAGVRADDEERTVRITIAGVQRLLADAVQSRRDVLQRRAERAVGSPGADWRTEGRQPRHEGAGAVLCQQ